LLEHPVNGCIIERLFCGDAHGHAFARPDGQGGQGVWIKVDWLWLEPLPPLLSVLKEWGPI